VPRSRSSLLLAAALCAALAAGGLALQAQRGGTTRVLQGTVVAVHDGDTLTLRGPSGDERVRLAQIDAPEHGQAWSRRARHALTRLVVGRSARLVLLDRDDYGRAVGDLYLDDLLVNEHLVREGHAWAYPRYVRSPAILEAEDEARRAGRGLWRLPPPEREPPWEWRRTHTRRSRGPGGASTRPAAGP
jgi:endonuclease YncB( thermonuclease family)